MTGASFILPPFAAPESLAPCIESLVEQDRDDIEIILFGGMAGLDVPTQPGKSPPIIVLPACQPGDTLPALLNRAIGASSGHVLVFVAEIVTFSPAFTRRYIEAIGSSPRPGFAYGCFHEAMRDGTDRQRDVRTDACDFAEGSLIGPVRAVPRACIDAVGAYDASLPHAFEYDLRLRLLERFEAVRIAEPLYRVGLENRAVPARRDLSHYRSYAPAAGPERPRSYLDYDADEEADFRSACLRSLDRRGARVKTPPQSLCCPHAFSPEQPITVIVPLWNREDTIGPALDSVLQTRDCPFEVVVVDNGSTDRGPDIVRAYAERAPVRLLHNEVNNIAGALNAGLRASRGKYICQLDSDDLYTPRTLPTLLRYMEQNPDAALGISYYDTIGPDGEILAERGITRHLEYDPDNLLRTDGIGHARIWHRCAIEELGGFDEAQMGNYAEDYDLQLKLCERYAVLRIPHVLYHYRINHKKPGETMPYAERHRKKTLARRRAVERRMAG